jgi:Tol biopolymer transport system component
MMRLSLESRLFPAFFAIICFTQLMECTSLPTEAIDSEPDLGYIEYSGISGRIAFSRMCNEGRFFVIVIDATNKISTMTEVPGIVFTASVALSPTSKEIAFSCIPRSEIMFKGYNIFSLIDTTISKLTDNNNHNLFPVFSADGAFIIYQYRSLDHPQLMRMNADGSSPLQMFTLDGNWDSRSSLNKAGNRVALLLKGEICLVEIDGGNPKTLAKPGASEYFYDPTWSPQNDKIAFVSRRGPNEIKSPPYSCTIMCVDTLHTSFDTIYTVQESSYSMDINIAWSPDGSKIAFSAPDSALSTHIFTVDPADKKITRITNTSIDVLDNGVSWVQSLP